MRYVLQLFLHRPPDGRIRLSGPVEFFKSIPKRILSLLEKVKNVGVIPGMNSNDQSKLGIFNCLNFFQFITGIILPVIGFFHRDQFPGSAWLVASLPALISVAVLVLNKYHRHQTALLVYFICYPVFICLSYINGISLGIELSFILYGILSVFFIRDIGYMIFSISFSMVSYFILSVIWKTYPYQLEKINFVVYLINQALAIIYIFYGLYLIKTENANYNDALQDKNLEMQRQSSQLHQQAEELEQLNSLKNKLFSVISHDLKAPMYALRTLFNSMQAQQMPGHEIRALIPDVNKDLNFAIGLMENLLQWTKSQMQGHVASRQPLAVRELAREIIGTLHLQAETKSITVENKMPEAVHVLADRDMISLVLRNLLSNAIKFTKPGGTIYLGAEGKNNQLELYVRDSGQGISPEDMNKIMGNDFYTTNGTAQEQGTGLGLLLCKEFLVKNGTHLRIDSERGKGSTFSFLLPLGD